MRRFKTRDDGFTLIEMLVVLGLISILASIAALSVSKFRAHAIKTACESDAKSVEVAARSYQAVNDSPPLAGGPPARTALVSPPPPQRQYIQNWPTSSSYEIWWDGANNAYGKDLANPPANLCT